MYAADKKDNANARKSNETSSSPSLAAWALRHACDVKEKTVDMKKKGCVRISSKAEISWQKVLQGWWMNVADKADERQVKGRAT